MFIRYCILKFTIGSTTLESKIKAVLILLFRIGKQEKKNNGPNTPNIINDLPASTKQVLVTEMLSKPKNPKDYKDREANEFEQAPLYLEQPVNLRQQPKLKVETVEIKKEIVKTNSLDNTDGSAKKNDGRKTG